jgi:hypothetical protein
MGKFAYIPVLPTTGQTALNRILSVAYSTAIVFVAQEVAAFEALYQVRPGLGRIPAVEGIWTNTPPWSRFCIYGTIILADK